MLIARPAVSLPVLAALLAGALLTALLPGCRTRERTEAPPASGPAPLAVGLVFDVGGRGDQSFNDAAFAGLDSARKDLGITYEVMEPGVGGERESALRELAAGRSQLIFGIGFLFSDDIRAVAREFPDKKFACVDMNVAEGDTLPPNLVALKFREEQGSYLVGAIAGLTSKTGVVGFLGGMQIPLIQKFEAGYKAGVKAVRPGARVLVKYTGTTGEAFKDPTKGKEIGLALYAQGADIVFHASGSTGLGLFEAARERDKLAIGVDSDQHHSMPGHVLTSMVKRVDVAVYDTIRHTIEGTFPSGQSLVFGLAEDGVGYVHDQRNAALFGPGAKAAADSLRDRIVAGAITVPSR
jgi:basic membrane protein A